MAQKKRGLGRGLQALIPETQSETPSTRPTDVFFPESDSPAEDRKSAETSENGETGEDSAIQADEEVCCEKHESSAAHNSIDQPDCSARHCCEEQRCEDEVDSCRGWEDWGRS